MLSSLLSLIRNKKSRIHDTFYKISKIGEGKSSKVYKVKEIKTKKIFTCKILQNNYQAQREVCIMKKINGSRLQTFHSAINTKKKLHIIADYIPGNDLFNEITNLTKKKKIKRLKMILSMKWFYVLPNFMKIILYIWI